MILSRYTLRNITSDRVTIPDNELFELPEKVLQFGTGVLLRGLPDYFIDKANRSGIFNGRIVVVKSTSQGDASAFDKQDGLFTLCVRGIANGETVEENIINSSISRVLNASEEWSKVLECAHNAQMQVIISNTTEVGIQLLQEDVLRHHPPRSFPGKLLSFLYERYKAFGGSEKSGMVIVPTELIPDNGTKLQSIVLELAHLNSLEDQFIEWLEVNNHFCNSLVDRIVPGRPDEDVLTALQQDLGYTDGLLTVSEVYRLWAIQGDQHIRSVLSFANADAGVIIEPDIDIYRELKLRMLNGTHILSSGLAFLAGCETVKMAMDDETMSVYILNLMMHEIAPNIPLEAALPLAEDFGTKVLDRFRNPHIRHHWINITLNYTSKIKLRCVPLLMRHYDRVGAVPELIATGFAAYIFFMKPVTVRDGKYYGESNGEEYLIQDESAVMFHKLWSRASPAEIVEEVLADSSLWGYNLDALEGFAKAVTDKLNLLVGQGIKETIDRQIRVMPRKPELR